MLRDGIIRRRTMSLGRSFTDAPTSFEKLPLVHTRTLRTTLLRTYGFCDTRVSFGESISGF